MAGGMVLGLFDPRVNGLSQMNWASVVKATGVENKSMVSTGVHHGTSAPICAMEGD